MSTAQHRKHHAAQPNIGFLRSTTKGEPRSMSSLAVSPPEAEASFGFTASEGCPVFLHRFWLSLRIGTCHPEEAASTDGCKAEDGHEAETGSGTGYDIQVAKQPKTPCAWMPWTGSTVAWPPAVPYTATLLAGFLEILAGYWGPCFCSSVMSKKQAG